MNLVNCLRKLSPDTASVISSKPRNVMDIVGIVTLRYIR